MEGYEIRLSGTRVANAYSNFMDRLNDHVKVLAENGKPITSVMGIKRMLYRYKRDLTPPSAELTPPQMGRTNPDSSANHKHEKKELGVELGLLVNDVQDKFDVDVFGAVEVGLVVEKDLKRALIKYYYERMAKEGKTYKDIKKVLSNRYGVSVSSIEKLVYGN